MLARAVFGRCRVTPLVAILLQHLFGWAGESTPYRRIFLRASESVSK